MEYQLIAGIPFFNNIFFLYVLMDTIFLKLLVSTIQITIIISQIFHLKKEYWDLNSNFLDIINHLKFKFQ